VVQTQHLTIYDILMKVRFAPPPPLLYLLFPSILCLEYSFFLYRSLTSSKYENTYPPLEKLLYYLPPLRSRHYSITSSPLVHPSEIRIF
jgi:hypothetical protein